MTLVSFVVQSRGQLGAELSLEGRQASGEAGDPHSKNDMNYVTFSNHTTLEETS